MQDFVNRQSSDLTVQRSGVSRVQALYITALSDEQVATLRKDEGITAPNITHCAPDR